MQQTVSWKYWLVATVLGISLLTVPGRSEPAASGTTSGADARSYTQFGRANGAKGDYDGAIAAFNQALQIDPKYVPAYYGRGMSHEMQKDDDAALSDYNRAVQIDPTCTPAYYQRGTLKGKVGDFDAAISDFKQVIKLDPKFAPAYYNLGHVYYFRGDLDGALEQLNQSLSLQPNFALGYFIRGLVRHAQDHREEAAADFQKSVGLNYPDGAFWYWICETENGQRGLSRQDLTVALAKPEIFKADDWPSPIGNFLLEKISQDQLIAAAGQGVPADVKDQLCRAWFYAGMVKHFLGDAKSAHDCFTQAVATDSKGSEEYVEANRQLAK